MENSFRIIISLDGFKAWVTKIEGKATLLFLEKAGRMVDNNTFSIYHYSSPEGLPKEDDKSSFAFLWRKLNALRDDKILLDPTHINNPRATANFQYLCKLTFSDLFSLLTKYGVIVKVLEIPHNGDEVKFMRTKKELKPWIDKETVFGMNPRNNEISIEFSNKKILIIDRIARWKMFEKMSKWIFS